MENTTFQEKYLFEDEEDNFDRNTETPYAVLKDGMVVVFINNEWLEFKEKE